MSAERLTGSNRVRCDSHFGDTIGWWCPVSPSAHSPVSMPTAGCKRQSKTWYLYASDSAWPLTLDEQWSKLCTNAARDRDAIFPGLPCTPTMHSAKEKWEYSTRNWGGRGNVIPFSFECPVERAAAFSSRLTSADLWWGSSTLLWKQIQMLRVQLNCLESDHRRKSHSHDQCPGKPVEFKVECWVNEQCPVYTVKAFTYQIRGDGDHGNIPVNWAHQNLLVVSGQDALFDGPRVVQKFRFRLKPINWPL